MTSPTWRGSSRFLPEGWFVAAAAVWITHALIPTPSTASTPGGAAPAGLLPAWAARVAFCDTLIIMPWLWPSCSRAAPATRSTSPPVPSSLDNSTWPCKAGTYNRLFGQVLGGLIAVVIQQFVFLADNLTNFLLTVFVVVLWLARRVVRAGAAAGLFVQALSGFILVLGLGIAQGGSEEYYGVRILKISVAVLYTYGALSLLSRLRQALPATAG